MAKKKNSATKNSGLSKTRKLEITGILTLAVAALLALCIITYQSGDYIIAQSISFENLLSAENSSSRQIQNGLGILGAYIAHFFVFILFGYISLVIPLILMGFGGFTFRRKRVKPMLWPTVYGLWGMILISVIIGWFYNQYDWFSPLWSGETGLGIAALLQSITGIGSIIILGVLFIVTCIAILDCDLQQTIDRVNVWLAGLKESRGQRAAERKKHSKEQARQKEVAKRQNAERKMKKQHQQPQKGESIEDIVARSQKEDEQRRLSEEEEVGTLDTRPRAIIDKTNDEETDEDDVDISVYVGKGDEEADAKELERQNKDKAKEVPEIKYKFPTINLLDSPPNEGNEVDLKEIKNNKRIILDKLKRHKIEILSINAIVGPTVTLYELEPAPDVKISKIESYANDLKMATAAHGLRIIAPIPGRSSVGIEVPNHARETVYIKTVINTKRFVETSAELPIAFGKTIENEVFLIDLTQMPHLLIAGATGSGKTVGINTIITCLLYKCNPEDLKFVMIDPKKIELSLYRNINNHFLATLPDAEEPIVTDTTRAMETLESLTKEMDERYDLMKMAMVRDIKDYNNKYDDNELDDELGHRHLPYIVVVVDELADLMMTAGKQIEEPIARLAQLARAVGIHLVVATQRPSVNVITGTIKANFPARMAYQVASKVDSRTILDIGGADQLVGRGDMLFTNGGGMTRIQNAFVSTEEVERITAFIGKQRGYKHPFRLPLVQDEAEGADIPDPLEDIDEYFAAAAKVIVLHQQGSVSLLQRKLKVGYNRAGRIIDQLYNAGVVGPFQGSTAREVLVADQDELEQLLEDLDEYNG